MHSSSIIRQRQAAAVHSSEVVTHHRMPAQIHVKAPGVVTTLVVIWAPQSGKGHFMG